MGPPVIVAADVSSCENKNTEKRRKSRQSYQCRMEAALGLKLLNEIAPLYVGVPKSSKRGTARKPTVTQIRTSGDEKQKVFDFSCRLHSTTKLAPSGRR